MHVWDQIWGDCGYFFVRQDTVPLGFGLKLGMSSFLRFQEMQLFKSLLTKLVVLGIQALLEQTFLYLSSFLVFIDQRSSPESAIHHCQVCKKTFSRSSLLKQHSVIHMGNKRFKFRCEVCGKMFRTRSHLRDHTRIHTGLSVIFCSCKILFTRYKLQCVHLITSCQVKWCPSSAKPRMF